MPQLILASSSPRRQELLSQMGLQFIVSAPEVDESMEGPPGQLVQELALAKAQAVWKDHPEGTILAADTLVYAGCQVLGKPGNLEEAAAMLHLLSGTWHEVYTGVCLIHAGITDLRHEVTQVLFARLTEKEITAYCQSGEVMGKAGAYAIQGKGGMFVEQIRGSYTNVVGLPTALVRRMLIAAGDYYVDGIGIYGTHRA